MLTNSEPPTAGLLKPAATAGRVAPLAAVVFIMVALTVADGVLGVVLFDLWGERFSLFLNQATAAVYIVWALLYLLAMRVAGSGGASVSTTPVDAASGPPPSPPTPWLTLITIGLMNGSGNFCMALAQPHTPGLTQSLLLLMLNIPMVLVLSWLCLRRRPSAGAAVGAALILSGSTFSTLRFVLQPSGSSAPPVQPLWWAIGMFAFAQLFLAGEKVYEDASFGRYARLRPMVMFFTTLVTQFALGWAVYPVQTLDVFGGVKFPAIVGEGCLCTIGRGGCDATHALVFWFYCLVDFHTYLFGLLVIRSAGATLMVLASAIALPLQQLVLCAHPIVGRWAESFFWGDGAALAFSLVGFGVFHRWSDPPARGFGDDGGDADGDDESAARDGRSTSGGLDARLATPGAGALPPHLTPAARSTRSAMWTDSPSNWAVVD